jgi:hypothetical protein
MAMLMRRRPLLRAAAIGSGAYVEGKRRIDLQERENAERAALQRQGRSTKTFTRWRRHDH